MDVESDQLIKQLVVKSTKVILWKLNKQIHFMYFIFILSIYLTKYVNIN